MNKNTIIRIKVPKNLYESVKNQFILEGKNDFGMPGSKTIKEKKASSDSPKKTSSSKKSKVPQKAKDTAQDKKNSTKPKMEVEEVEKNSKKDDTQTAIHDIINDVYNHQMSIGDAVDQICKMIKKQPEKKIES